MKAKELRELIDFISNTGLEEVNIETEEFKIKVKRSSGSAVVSSSPAVAAPTQAQTAAPTPSPTASAPAEPAKESGGDQGNYIEIKSPMIGTFYRSANPDSAPFIEVGDKISTGDTVCIVEAMKLFNEIESEFSGTIVKVLVENASPVEFDQPLFLVDPS